MLANESWGEVDPIPPTVNRASTVATLSGLIMSAETPSPTFVSGTKVYTASVGNAINGVTVTPTVTDSTAHGHSEQNASRVRCR